MKTLPNRPKGLLPLHVTRMALACFGIIVAIVPAHATARLVMPMVGHFAGAICGGVMFTLLVNALDRLPLVRRWSYELKERESELWREHNRRQWDRDKQDLGEI